MKEFKSSAYIVVKNLIYGIIGGAVIAFILNIWINIWYALGLGVLIAIWYVLTTLLKDMKKVVIYDDRFEIVRRGKVLHSFKRSEVAIRASIRTKGGDSDCTLRITSADGREELIDCSMLGRNRFYRLIDELGVLDPEPIELKTKKKD